MCVCVTATVSPNFLSLSLSQFNDLLSFHISRARWREDFKIMSFDLYQSLLFLLLCFQFQRDTHKKRSRVMNWDCFVARYHHNIPLFVIHTHVELLIFFGILSFKALKRSGKWVTRWVAAGLKCDKLNAVQFINVAFVCRSWDILRVLTNTQLTHSFRGWLFNQLLVLNLKFGFFYCEVTWEY